MPLNKSEFVLSFQRFWWNYCRCKQFYVCIYLFFIRLFVRSYLSFLSFPLSPFSVFVFAFFFLSKKYKICPASRLSNLALFRPIYGNPRNFSLGNPDSIRESFARGILMNLGLWNPDSLEMSGIQSVSPRNVIIIIIIFYLLVFQTLPVYLSSPNSSGVPIVFETDHYSVKIGSNSLARFM